MEEFVIKYNKIIEEIYKINKEKKKNNIVSRKIIINKKKIFELFFKKFKFNLLKFKFISKNEIYETISLIKNFQRFFFTKNKKKKEQLKEEIIEQTKDLSIITVIIIISIIPIPGSGFVLLGMNRILKKLGIGHISNLEKINLLNQKIIEKYEEIYLNNSNSTKENFNNHINIF